MRVYVAFPLLSLLNGILSSWAYFFGFVVEDLGLEEMEK